VERENRLQRADPRSGDEDASRAPRPVADDPAASWQRMGLLDGHTRTQAIRSTRDIGGNGGADCGFARDRIAPRDQGPPAFTRS
jgi:hypothetical protein